MFALSMQRWRQPGLNQDAYHRSRQFNEPGAGVLNKARRFLPTLSFFAIAFTVDQLTGQRYSSVWGSAAIIASAVSLFPAIRPALAAFGGFTAIWVVFNLARAVADTTPLALAGAHAVSRWESALFGGRLPSEYLQLWLYDVGDIQVYDGALSIVYGSFFIAPFLVAGVVWWKRRSLFPRYAAATAICFGIGLVGFVLLPTAPPWLSDSDDVRRITHQVVESTTGVSLGGDGGGAVDREGFRFEPNHLAALPSVHVAAVVMVFLVLRQFGRALSLAGGVYALAMTFSVVYLGEHFVIDAVLGWVLALAGWGIARRWLANVKRFEI